jgi:hypothetical protein
MVYAIDIAGEGDNPLMADAQIDVGDGAAGSPFGSLDEVLPRDDGTVSVRGWSADPDVLGSPTRIHVYVDGPAGSGTFVHEGTANSSRPDVAAAIAGAGPDHGYDLRVPGLAPGPHQLFVYAINAGGGGDNPLLGSARALVLPASASGPGTPAGAAGSPVGTAAAGGTGSRPGVVPPKKRVGALGTLRSATVRFTTKRKRGVRRRYAVVRATVRGTSAASRLQFSTDRKRILTKTAVRSSVSVRTRSSRIYVRLWTADGRRGPWVKAAKAKARTARRG